MRRRVGTGLGSGRWVAARCVGAQRVCGCAVRGCNGVRRLEVRVYAVGRLGDCVSGSASGFGNVRLSQCVVAWLGGRIV